MKQGEREAVEKSTMALSTVKPASMENTRATTSLDANVLYGAYGDKSEKLPIDAHRDTILNKIRNDRVIIIHGETGMYMHTYKICMRKLYWEGSNEKLFFV